jgi:elongation factor G
MGELHLEIIVDRMKREFNVEANVGKPQVAYRETITQAVEGEGKFVKQTGGRGQYGHVKIKIEPASRARASSSRTRSRAAARFRRSSSSRSTKGIKEALERGVLAGYPMVDVKVELYDGSYHDVDSSEMAFKIAGSMAFRTRPEGQARAARADDAVEVVTPEDYMGDVMGDLCRAARQIQGMDDARRADHQRDVPLSEMFGYATDLRSRRRAARPTRCTSIATSRRRRTSPKKSSPRRA